MISLHRWQWVVLLLPIGAIALFLVVVAGWQLHTWHLTWLWGVVTLVLAGWWTLVARWTRPSPTILPLSPPDPSPDLPPVPVPSDLSPQLEALYQRVVAASRRDPPLWQDGFTFGRRCQELVEAIALIYHPTAKYPWLNVKIPQLYGLFRDTVNDTDRWMQQLEPLLNQVTLHQAVRGYEISQTWGKIAQRLGWLGQGVRWLLDPGNAALQLATQGVRDRATQDLLRHLEQRLRETALRHLSQRAIALYRGESLPLPPPSPTTTLLTILEQAQPEAPDPLQILVVGRTGAGKSSVINGLFMTAIATVDILPTTQKLQAYHWQIDGGDPGPHQDLTVWDTPGYGQVPQDAYLAQILAIAPQADLLLLVTPAPDPALAMDVDLLRAIQAVAPKVPVITAVTQVDRLRPLREWSADYCWETGDRPKEVAIRAAVAHRAEVLKEFCPWVQPVVPQGPDPQHQGWEMDQLIWLLIHQLGAAQQVRLSRHVQSRRAKAHQAHRIIEKSLLPITTTQTLTALLKSPVLGWLSTLATGSPALAHVLAEQIPLEQLPLVLGKLQLAHDLFCLLQPPGPLDFLALWPILRDTQGTAKDQIQALGHTLVEAWSQPQSSGNLMERYGHYLHPSPGA